MSNSATAFEMQNRLLERPLSEVPITSTQVRTSFIHIFVQRSISNYV